MPYQRMPPEHSGPSPLTRRTLLRSEGFESPLPVGTIRGLWFHHPSDVGVGLPEGFLVVVQGRVVLFLGEASVSEEILEDDDALGGPHGEDVALRDWDNLGLR